MNDQKVYRQKNFWTTLLTMKKMFDYEKNSGRGLEDPAKGICRAAKGVCGSVRGV